MADDNKGGRPKDFPDEETERVSGYIPKHLAKTFKTWVLWSDDYGTISQALKVALEEFLEKRKEDQSSETGSEKSKS